LVSSVVEEGRGHAWLRKNPLWRAANVPAGLSPGKHRGVQRGNAGSLNEVADGRIGCIGGGGASWESYGVHVRQTRGKLPRLYVRQGEKGGSPGVLRRKKKVAKFFTAGLKKYNPSPWKSKPSLVFSKKLLKRGSSGWGRKKGGILTLEEGANSGKPHFGKKESRGGGVGGERGRGRERGAGGGGAEWIRRREERGVGGGDRGREGERKGEVVGGRDRREAEREGEGGGGAMK